MTYPAYFWVGGGGGVGGEGVIWFFLNFAHPNNSIIEKKPTEKCVCAIHD